MMYPAQDVHEKYANVIEELKMKHKDEDKDKIECDNQFNEMMYGLEDIAGLIHSLIQENGRLHTIIEDLRQVGNQLTSASSVSMTSIDESIPDTNTNSPLLSLRDKYTKYTKDKTTDESTSWSHSHTSSMKLLIKLLNFMLFSMYIGFIMYMSSSIADPEINEANKSDEERNACNCTEMMFKKNQSLSWDLLKTLLSDLFMVFRSKIV